MRKGRRGGRGEEEDRRKRRGGPAEEEERRRGRGEEEEERKERRGGRGEEERRRGGEEEEDRRGQGKAEHSSWGSATPPQPTSIPLDGLCGREMYKSPIVFPAFLVYHDFIMIS